MEYSCIFFEILQALRRWPCNRPIIFDVPEPKISFHVYLKCAVDNPKRIYSKHMLRMTNILNVINHMFYFMLVDSYWWYVVWKLIRIEEYTGDILNHVHTLNKENTHCPTIMDDCPMLILSVKLDLLKKRKHDAKHLILTLNLLITVFQALIGAKSKYHNTRSVKIPF